MFFITPGLALLPERCLGPEGRRACGQEAGLRACGKRHQSNAANATGSLNGAWMFPNGLSRGVLRAAALPDRLTGTAMDAYMYFRHFLWKRWGKWGTQKVKAAFSKRPQLIRGVVGTENPGL